MIVTECAFCEAPSTKLDENGFCGICSKSFEILTAEEIQAIQEKVGWEKKTPDGIYRAPR